LKKNLSARTAIVNLLVEKGLVPLGVRGRVPEITSEQREQCRQIGADLRESAKVVVGQQQRWHAWYIRTELGAKDLGEVGEPQQFPGKRTDAKRVESPAPCSARRLV